MLITMWSILLMMFLGHHCLEAALPADTKILVTKWVKPSNQNDRVMIQVDQEAGFHSPQIGLDPSSLSSIAPGQIGDGDERYPAVSTTNDPYENQARSAVENQERPSNENWIVNLPIETSQPETSGCSSTKPQDGLTSQPEGSARLKPSSNPIRSFTAITHEDLELHQRGNDGCLSRMACQSLSQRFHQNKLYYLIFGVCWSPIVASLVFILYETRSPWALISLLACATIPLVIVLSSLVDPSPRSLSGL